MPSASQVSGIADDALKSELRKTWENAAPGWAKWEHVFSAGLSDATDTLIDMAGIQPGMRVLDLACGAGSQTIQTAKRVGRNGSIVTLYVPPSLAAKRATQDVPIVVIVGDPVETGIVPSLAHPGGNITGVSLMASQLGGKSVELFRDMMPSARRVGVLGHSTNPVFAKSMLAEVLAAGRTTDTQIEPVVMVSGPEEADSAFATMAGQRADAVVVQGSLVVKAVTDMAIKHRVPTASTARAFVDIGGLMSFGADGPTAFRHGAKFVQRILQGKLPKDIPLEQPTKFELAINLKTAKAIGLTIPETFLRRVDVLIE